MSEMVLVLPLLIIVLASVVFFGRGMVRAQRARVMDRYEAWRQVDETWTNRGGGPYDDLAAPHGDDPRGNPLLNQTFFAGNAAVINMDTDGTFPLDANSGLIDAASRFSTQTGDMVTRQLGMADHGRHVALKTTHTNNVPAWTRFDGPIHHGHVRIGHDWKLINGWRTLDPINLRDAAEIASPQWPGNHAWTYFFGRTTNINGLFPDLYRDLDQSLSSLGGNPLANQLRDLYLAGEGYRGPAVDLD